MPSRRGAFCDRLRGEFCCELVDVVADRAPAVKPQSAFFEQLGLDYFLLAIPFGARVTIAHGNRDGDGVLQRYKSHGLSS